MSPTNIVNEPISMMAISYWKREPQIQVPVRLYLDKFYSFPI